MKTIAILLLFVFSDPLHAAIPAAAQEPFKKGMSAVQLKDFPLAIRYFNEARAAAPDATEVLFNLALAEAQVPGRELRATCWFESYLALSPGGANAEAVRQQISDLEIRTEGNVRKTIDAMKILAGKFPAGDSSGTSAMVQVSRTLAKSGDLTAAIATVEALSSDDRDTGRKSVVDTLANMDRFDDAKKLAGAIGSDAQYKTTRSDAYMSIAQVQLTRGLLADARQSLGNMSGSSQHARMLGELAAAFLKKGNPDDAVAIVSEMKQIADKIDKSNQQYALQYLAAGQAAVGQREDALATLKRMDALLPAKASSSNNYGIHNAVEAHLNALDVSGARALIPRLIDDPGFKYKSSAIDKVNQSVNQLVVREFQEIQKLNQPGDIPAMESALAKTAMSPVVRIWGFAALANLYKQEARTDQLPGLLEKAAAAFPGVGDIPISKAAASNWIANIAVAAGNLTEARNWRLRALQPIDLLMKTGSQSVGYDLSSLFGYYQYAGVAQAITSAALASGDEKTFQAGVDAVRRSLPKLDVATQATMSGTVLWHHWWVDKNFDTAADFIKIIPDAKLRQQALDKHHEIQFSKLLATENLSGASQVFGQISDAPAGNGSLQKSEKAALQRNLSDAFADAGDWGNAEKTAAAISDAEKRKSAQARIASSRAEGQFKQTTTEQDEAQWREKRTALDALMKPEDRLKTYWELCGSAREGLLDEQRKIMPDYFAAALATAKPDERLSALQSVSLAAQRLDLFELERHIRAAALSALEAGSSPNWYSAADVLSRASLADYIEHSSIRWHDEILIKAMDRLVADGNPAAAVELVGKLNQTDESARNKSLVTLLIAQGNLKEARAAFDKIGKDDSKNGQAKSYATQEMARACIKSGDLAAAKTLFDDSRKLRDNESIGSTIIAEIGTAGELEWARERAQAIRYAPNRHEAEGAIVGTMAAHSQDAEAAKAVLRSMLEDGVSYYQYKVIEALITAGNPQLALRLIPELSDLNAQTSETVSAVTALARSGDAVSAKKAAANIGNNARRFSARSQIAAEQVKLGDLDSARATLLEARKLDARTSNDMEMDAWMEEKIFYALRDKGDFAAAQAIAVKMQNPVRHDSLLRSLCYSALQKKNLIAAQSALAGLSDPRRRAKAMEDMAVYAEEPAHILTLIDQTEHPESQTFALARALNKTISLKDVSSVQPRVLALPDGAAKAHLLCDIMRARVSSFGQRRCQSSAAGAQGDVSNAARCLAHVAAVRSRAVSSADRAGTSAGSPEPRRR